MLDWLITNKDRNLFEDTIYDIVINNNNKRYIYHNITTTKDRRT